MAFRLHNQVLRGEIDNRVRDRIVGRIWFFGRREPVELSLTGNAWRDLAGRRLEFVNPQPRAGDMSTLAARQTGVIGDCTASRKVKVPDVSDDDLKRLIEARQPFPWHWGNSLYLEWYGETNGRVVIESASYQLTVTHGATWEMTEEEELEQRKANAAALGDFMSRLADAVAANTVEAKEVWEPDRPMTEAEAEAVQAESDKLADRIQARLDREGPDADYEKILEEELERRARERGEEPLSPEQEAESAAWVDEMNRAGEAALESPDRDQQPDHEHPLVEQACELASRVYTELEKQNAIPASAGREHPVIELINGTLCAGPKLAGALHGKTWPPDLDSCAAVLVRLKRAHGYLEDALLAATDCVEQKLIDPKWLTGVRAEIEAIAQTCRQMITELRDRLENGGQ